MASDLNMKALIANNVISKEAANFLKAKVKSSANILFCGFVGSGKSTILNACMEFIPKKENAVYIKGDELRNEEIAKTRNKPTSKVEAVYTDNDNLANTASMILKAQAAEADNNSANKPKTAIPRFIIDELPEDITAYLLAELMDKNARFMTSYVGYSTRAVLQRLNTQYLINAKSTEYTGVVSPIIFNSIDLCVEISKIKDVYRVVRIISPECDDNELGGTFDVLFKYDIKTDKLEDLRDNLIKTAI